MRRIQSSLRCGDDFSEFIDGARPAKRVVKPSGMQPLPFYFFFVVFISVLLLDTL